jgi:cob(I)alamin adenosyltransferase
LGQNLKIYTGFGDAGKTKLLGGQTVDKDHIRVEVYGTLDELSSLIGLVLTSTLAEDLRKGLLQTQNDLFSLSAELATPPKHHEKMHFQKIGKSDVKRIEDFIDHLESKLPPLTNFILPGGSQGAALLHLARTVCRRAERRLTTLKKQFAIRDDIAVYLNRISDLLFVAARFVNKQAQAEDMIWRSKKNS